MVVERKFKRILMILGVLFVAVAIVFWIRYRKVNDPKSRIDISENELHYGEANEEYGVFYIFYEPKVKKRYDKDYGQNVYTYEIPFEFTNINEEITIDIVSVQYNTCIFSGGEVWQGTFKTDDVKTKLDPNERSKGSVMIDVIPRKGIPKEKYDKFEFYYISDQGDVIFKQRYKM